MQEFTPFIWRLGAVWLHFNVICNASLGRLFNSWGCLNFDFVYAFFAQKNQLRSGHRNTILAFVFLTFNGGISALPMTQYHSNLAVKTALLRVGAGVRRAGRCWDTSLDFYPPPPTPLLLLHSIPPLLLTFPHWILCEESRRTRLSPPDVHLAAKQMALPIKMGLISLIFYFFFLEGDLGRRRRTWRGRKENHWEGFQGCFLFTPFSLSFLTNAEHAWLCVQKRH